MALRDILTVAVYALKEAKDNVPGCGIASELLTISNTGEIGCLGWLHSSHVERFAESFQYALMHLFVETCDLEASEDQVKGRFDHLWETIQATREYLKEDKNTSGTYSTLIENMVKRKTKEI